MKTSEQLANAVKSYQAGDKEAFAELYEQSYRYLYACVMYVVKDEETTQDMLQETYLEIVKSIGTLKDTENFLNWAAVIANRKCFAYLKKNKKLPVEDADGMIEEIPDDVALIPEELMQDREKQRLIREIIDNLSGMQRLCVIGYYYNEQSQESLAEEFGIPVGTVKSHLSRARAKIKLAVEELDVKKGTRLYNVAPLMLALLEEEVRTCIIKPLSVAFAGAAGAETAGKVSFLGKLKAAWAKLSAGAKAKAAVGAAAAGTVGIVAAAAFLGPKPETIPISEETKELLDQVLQICGEGDYERLCNLDFSMADPEYDYPGTNVIYCHDENGKSVLGQFHYNDDGRLSHSWYYDGKSRRLKETLTGYGMFIRGPYFAVGWFEDGQAVGNMVSFQARVYNDESDEKNPDLMRGMDDVIIFLTEVNVENGIPAGEASRATYRLDADGQPYLRDRTIGNVVPVRDQQGDAHLVELYFDGRVDYFEDAGEPENYTFYLKNGCIDPEHYRSRDGEWLDENGKPVGTVWNMRPGERQRNFCLITDSEMFDRESLEMIEIQE